MSDPDTAGAASQSARDIVETLLERTTRSLMTGDFDLFADCIWLPYSVETFAGKRAVETREMLAELFDFSRRFYRMSGVTQIVRHCVQAEELRDALIVSTYETRLIQYGSFLPREPFTTFVEIACRDTIWRVQRGQYAIADSPAHNKVLLGQSATGT
ncbi:hypothetical protein [Cognatishimia sp. F0-27]|uniref:hypothetical protein n=1 Tax=Cognatishimia sp. F0-27 TaxID=2816855 RepID=UPI001D0CB177|nr:hypothetical protein [Cognatishimia sp. F0-27]MCC1493096.1 hypothetical protein [Cognatishimia sp. F0-27]